MGGGGGGGAHEGFSCQHAMQASMLRRTVRFGSTAKVLADCKLKYYRISE